MQIELSEQESKQLIALLDAAVRGSGLTAALMAVKIVSKIEDAEKARQAVKVAPEPRDSE